MTADRRAEVTANGLATALLAGAWRRREMVRRVAVALGYARAPRWVGTLVTEVLAAYRHPPADRPSDSRPATASADTRAGTMAPANVCTAGRG